MCDLEFSRKLKRLAGKPAAEFVLHREPMLLLDTLVDVGPGFAICEWQVLDSNELMAPGFGIPAYAGIEYMAQGVAVYAGARARVNGLSPPLGFLLGTRHYQARIQYFDVGATYRLACRELIRDSEGMGSFDCQITFEDISVAEARLTVLEKQQGKELND
jgi:predicted hotdog family 3-hydroxylacyl-ACP dehydratase